MFHGRLVRSVKNGASMTAEPSTLPSAWKRWREISWNTASRRTRSSADIRVVHKGDDIILRIRDDCTAFDPTEYHKVMNMDKDGKNAGIQLVYGIARKVQYQNLLGMNVLTIFI